MLGRRTRGAIGIPSKLSPAFGLSGTDCSAKNGNSFCVFYSISSTGSVHLNESFGIHYWIRVWTPQWATGPVSHFPRTIRCVFSFASFIAIQREAFCCLIRVGISLTLFTASIPSTIPPIIQTRIGQVWSLSPVAVNSVIARSSTIHGPFSHTELYPVTFLRCIVDHPHFLTTRSVALSTDDCQERPDGPYTLDLAECALVYHFHTYFRNSAGFSARFPLHVLPQRFAIPWLKCEDAWRNEFTIREWSCLKSNAPTSLFFWLFCIFDWF
jgi:hypothetical protein